MRICLSAGPGRSVPGAGHNKNHLSSSVSSFLFLSAAAAGQPRRDAAASSQHCCPPPDKQRMSARGNTADICPFIAQMHRTASYHAVHLVSYTNYCLSSIPSSSRPFRIFFIAAETSASSSVLSFARNTMEYATDLKSALICSPSYRSNSL